MKTRKLRATWTLESGQDLMAYHSMIPKWVEDLKVGDIVLVRKGSYPYNEIVVAEIEDKCSTLQTFELMEVGELRKKMSWIVEGHNLIMLLKGGK